MNSSWPGKKFALMLFSLLAILSSAEAAAQTTIHVPADVPTIQAAIDAAKNGDTVFVSPGTYDENIDFHGKAITVTSGAKSFTDIATTTTIINGTNDGPVANFATGETSAAVLNGFVLTGGHTSMGSNLPGGGVLVDHASPTIQNNVITNNSGCGVLIVNQASPLIQGNDVKNSLYTDTGNLYPCTAADGGGNPGTGIVLYNADSPSVIGNVIEDNAYSAGESANQETTGAGIYISGTNTVLIENNIIRNNFSNSFAAVAGVRGNMAQHLVLVQNLIYGNSNEDEQVYLAGSYGGSSPTLTETNNTIVGGGEDVSLYFGPSTITNNIIYSPASLNAGVGGLSCSLLPDNSAPVTIQNNDLFGTASSTVGPCTLGAGNLQTAPSFVNLEGSDFHETASSITVGAGQISAPSLPASDLDNKARRVCGTVDMGVYEVHPIPPIALTVSPNPAPGQSSVTLTATLTGNCNIPTGLITFMDGSTILGTASLNGSAVATFSTSFLFVGTHNLTATYPGDFNFAPSTSNTVTEVITGPPTTTVLNSVSPNPALPLEPITMTATISSAFTVPTGTITFMTGGKALATATVAANGTASGTVSTLGVGTYPITAEYGGSTEYSASTSNTILEVVNGAPTTTVLTSSLNPSNFGQTVTFTAMVAAPQSTTTPSGSVTFMDGATSLGTVPLSTAYVAQLSTASLAAGSHTITAVYGGSTNDNKSTSNTIVQIVNLNTAAVDLTGSPNPADAGQSVTFTATASGIMLGATPDVVTFYDGSNSIGSVSLSAAGTASISISSLTLGTHTITAILPATTTHTAATSNAVSEVIIQASFSFTGSGINLVTGRSGTGSLQLASMGGFTGDVSITCNPPFPPNYTCSVQISSVSLTAGLSKVFTYTLHPSDTASAIHSRTLSNHTNRIVFASLFPITLFSLIGLTRRRRYTHLRTLLSLALLAVLASATTACGPDQYIEAPTPGTYPIFFTATGTNQGTTTPVTQALHLTVVLAP